MKDNITELQAKPHSDDDYIHAAHLMERMGGGFAAAIAQAYYKADKYNRARLRAAFPDLFTRYYNMYLNDINERKLQGG